MERLRWMSRRARSGAERGARASRGAARPASLIAQAIQMGDECHNRNRAATSLLPACAHARAARAGAALGGRGRRGALHLRQRPLLPQPLDAGRQVDRRRGSGGRGSSIVTTMARNGTRFGIRLSGTGDRWFTGPAGVVDGLYLPGYGPDDANLDIGDSTITETVGLGGFAMAAAPAIVSSSAAPPRTLSPPRAAMYDDRVGGERAPTGFPRSASGGRRLGHRLPRGGPHGRAARRSTPASRTASRASARSVPASSSRRWRRSSKASPRLPTAGSRE